jgi:pimeloyl-CoA dehydrogenase large subunit
MDLRFTEEERAFRAEVRQFCEAEIPAEIRRKATEGRELEKQDIITSQRILNAKGCAVPRWPVEWGGQAWLPIKNYILTEELQQNGVPQPLAFNCDMIGPVIATFGNEAQKNRFLPRAANLDDWWCQGFSEPGAGSDLAALGTRAVRDGDHYVVNGQKTWTTLAQYADWIFCLARTGLAAKKQSGISFILIDMKSPGIVVRPIITVEGRHEVNEVFFDDVRVPIENLIGEENRGWDYAKYLLSHERTGIARIGITKRRLSYIKYLAKRTPSGDGAIVWDDAKFRARFNLAEIELKALEITQMRVVAAQGKGEAGRPDPASSILKIKGSELQQTATELMIEVAGPEALAFVDGPIEGSNAPFAGLEWASLAAETYFNYRKVSIYGGSNEIQRNIIAKSVLGF